jgi:hypothetical protein
MHGIGLLLLLLVSNLICSDSASAATAGDNELSTVVFKRVQEPNENAFSLLIPSGWQLEGGIFRVDPTAQGGAAQSIAAKCDLTVKQDRAGSVMIHWLPDMLYFDARMSPAGQMGLFPPGSNYSGMTVMPLLPAQSFLSQMAFPYLHPGATDVRILEQKPLQDFTRKYQQRVQAAFPGLTFSYDAALLTVTYREEGVTYKEMLVTLIENWGQLGAGMWGNKETFVLRAPADEFDRWQSLFSIIQNSLIFNPRWIAGEVQGQITRGEIALNTQREVQRIEQDIVQHRQQTNAEIHNDMFLTLTDQEEFVNPHTNQVETGSNQWQNRWINDNGDVIYTDVDDYNPNHDIDLHSTGFKRSQIRQR